MSSVSNGLYFLTLLLVSIVCYLYIKRNVEKVWVACYALGVHYLLKNTVFCSDTLLECLPLFIFLFHLDLFCRYIPTDL